MLGAAIGVVGTLGVQKMEKDKQNVAVPKTDKTDYHPESYLASLKKYGHLKDLKDYPNQIRWYDPKYDDNKTADENHKNRIYEKLTENKKWEKISHLEYQYYFVSAKDNTDYKYFQKKKSEAGKRVYYLLKKDISESEMEKFRKSK